MVKSYGGRLVQGFCNCGRPAAKKGTDHKGRARYRNRCSGCRTIAQASKIDQCNWCLDIYEDMTLLHVDHIDGNPANNDESNLQTLCIPCHINKTIIYKDWKSNGKIKGKDDGMNKTCPDCNEVKAYSEYYKSNILKNGIVTYCKKCTNKRNKKEREYRKETGPTIFRESKECQKCNNIKPISQFVISRSSCDGYGSYCKPCWLNITKAAQLRAKERSKNS